MSAAAKKTDQPYGVMAMFATAPDLFHAAERVRDEGYKKWDVYSPFPIHGIDGAMGLTRSKVPIPCFIGGITGFCLGMLVTWAMNAYDYPLIVGGKPYWNPVYPFPIMYELNILLAAFGTFFGMFISNRLPQHYHPAFNHSKFERASDDLFFLMIEHDDPRYDEGKVRGLLEELGGTDIETVKG